MAFCVVIGTGTALEAEQTFSVSTSHFSEFRHPDSVSVAEISAKASKKGLSFVAATCTDNYAESWELLTSNRPHKGNTKMD